MKPQGVMLATFLIFIGKLETNYMYIAHQKYLPAPLIEGFNPIMLYTLEIGSFYVSDEIYMQEALIERFGYKIETPNPKDFGLPIISRAIPRFEFNLDWEDLIKYMARYEVGDDLKSAIREYIAKFYSSKKKTDILAPFNSLKEITYENLLLAISLKKGRKLSSGETIGELFNPNIRQMVRDKLDQFGFTDK
jgi:hypothetical protein